MNPATCPPPVPFGTRRDGGVLELVVVMPDLAWGELLREGLHRDLGLRVLAVCGLAEEAEAALRRERDCDLVIADPWLSDAAGADLVERVRGLRPTLPILLHTSRVDPLTVDVMLRAGVGGVIEKGAPLEELLAAVPKVARGEAVFSAAVAAVVRGFVVGAGLARGGGLTRREQEIGRRLVGGESATEIAAALALSPRTVLNARRRIATKLGIDTSDRRTLPEWMR